MSKITKGTIAYTIILLLFSVYVVLDSFVITRVYGDEVDTSDASEESMTEIQSEDEAETDAASDAKEQDNESTVTETVISDSEYSDGNISVKLSTFREYDTTIYAADVQLASAEYLKTALAQGTYGKNVKADTSEIAEGAGAILAINGDYYGVRESGYVIKNGTLYRDTGTSNQEDLVIYEDGSFGIIDESEVSAEELIADGAVQTLSFGPVLVEDGEIAVYEGQEITGRSMDSNPRTAIGIIDECHYIFLVSDGRTGNDAGLSLYELAEVMQELGARTAYNLDGGGSSTMYFNEQVINTPIGGRAGHGSGSERSVSDIVYVGY